MTTCMWLNVCVCIGANVCVYAHGVNAHVDVPVVMVWYPVSQWAVAASGHESLQHRAVHDYP